MLPTEKSSIGCFMEKSKLFFANFAFNAILEIRWGVAEVKLFADVQRTKND